MVKKDDKNKNRERALKAWKTMRERGYHKYKDRSQEDFYDNQKKNKIRQKIASIIKKYSGGNKILTLETNRFMLPSLLKKYDFFIAENNKEEYLRMIECKPNNVFLHYGGIDEMKDLVIDFNTIYLDFCCGYNSALPVINKLVDKINKCNVVGFSFSLRRNNKEYLEDYTLDLIFKLQQFLGSEFSPVYKTAYAESGPMTTIFFAKAKKIEQKNDKEESEEEYKKNRKREEKEWVNEVNEGKRITKWTIKKLNTIYPHIWTPYQIFDARARTNLIKNDFSEAILYRLFMCAFKENIIKTPFLSIKRQYLYNKKEELSMEGLFHYYIETVFANIFNLWKREDKAWQAWNINWESFVDRGHDLFLINKNDKRNKCYLCKEENGIFKFNNKDFCVNCYIRHLTDRTRHDSGPEDKYITGKYGYSLKFTNGEYYYGDKECHLCKKKFIKEENKNQDVKITIFGNNNYHPECYKSDIALRYREVQELKEEYEKEVERRILSIYKLKRRDEKK